MGPWLIAIIIYSFFAVITAIPTAYAILKGVKPHDGGDSFEGSVKLPGEWRYYPYHR